MQKKYFFYSSFLKLFGFWAKKFSDFSPKYFKNLSKLPSTCPEEQFVARNFFLKFWIVLDFLQKPLAWFSKFYIRVQSKNCGKNSFFLFFFQQIFRILSKMFSHFWPKNFKNLWKLTSACPQEQLVALIFFFKSFEPFWILCRNLRRGSQNSIYVSRVKIALETVFLFFFSEFFSDFERKIFENFGHKTSRICQNYLLRV